MMKNVNYILILLNIFKKAMIKSLMGRIDDEKCKLYPHIVEYFHSNYGSKPINCLK